MAHGKLNTNRGAKRAREARADAGLPDDAPLECVLSFVEEAMSVPVAIVMLPDRISGCCYRGADGERTILWVNGAHSHARQRFTLAHELGHLRCGHDGKIPVETFMTIGGKSTDDREVQANAFAAELLAPKAGVTTWAEGRTPGLDDVLELAAWCGLSAIASLYRLNQLGLISDGYDELRATILDGDPAPPAPYTDAITACSAPRLSPVLHNSALAALVAGAASAEAVARVLGIDADTVAGSATDIGV